MNLLKNLFEKIKNKGKLIYIFLILIIIIRFYISKYSFDNKYSNLNINQKFEVMVINIEKVSDSKISYLVKLKENNKYEDKFILNLYEMKFKSSNNSELLKQHSKYNYGDILELTGKLTIPEKLNNPYEFDYKRYLNSKNIYGTINTYGLKYLGNNPNSIFFKKVCVLKTNISYEIDSRLLKDEAALFKSMLYGDDSGLTDKITNDFKLTGLSHLIAVSGSNISSLLIILNYILEKLKFKSKIKLIIINLVIIAFLIIANLELSILRAGIMAMVSILIDISSRKRQKYMPLVISFIIILVYNPYSLFNVGFIFSYLAVLGIYFFNNLINSYILAKVNRYFSFNKLYKLKRWSNIQIWYF